MFIKGESLTGRITPKEVVSFARHVTEGRELEETTPYKRGLTTKARGFFVTDFENKYDVAVVAMEHEPISWLRTSRLGRKLLNRNFLQATIVVNDLQEPANDIELAAYPKGVTLLEGELGSPRRFSQHPTVDDIELVNEALVKVVTTHGS